jgi:hypothetical protein
VSRRERQDAPAAAAENERRSGLLYRPGEERVPAHLVVVAVEGEGTVRAEQTLHDLHRLFEPLHPDARRVVGDARLGVVRLHPSGAEAHFEATFAQHIERGRLLGQDERVPVVVPEDE